MERRIHEMRKLTHHHINVLHIYCRLVDWGVGKKTARVACEWLEAISCIICFTSKKGLKMTKKLDFGIRYYTNDGEVGVAINGVGYLYHLDAGLIPKVVRTSRRAPGRALAFLKVAARSYERMAPL